MSIQGDPAGMPDLFGGDANYRVSSIYDVSPNFLGDLAQYFTANPFPTPISQITGFTQITPYAANVKTNENTSQVSFVDLATPGPTLSSLPDGTYVAGYGAAMGNTNTLVRSRMALSVNGASPDGTLQAFAFPANTTALVGSSFWTTFTLNAGGSNSLKAQYSSGASNGNAQFESRWLVAIRISGP